MFDILLDEKLIGRNDLNLYFEEFEDAGKKGGGITGAGKDFLEGALIGATTSEDNIRRLRYDGTKSIRQKLVRAIIPVLENQGMGEYRITPELNLALDVAIKAAARDERGRRYFASISDYAAQEKIFERDDEVAEALAMRLDRTPTEFTAFIGKLNKAMKEEAAGQKDMFGKTSRYDILKRILLKKNRKGEWLYEEDADNEGMGSSPEERQEVIDRYANADGSKKGGWGKAPNGKDTNLTERQWVEVRTPSFKAKHGDWERLANAKISRHVNTVSEAEKIAKQFIDKELVNERTGTSANISNKSLGKLTSEKATKKSVSPKVHALAIANIDRLFEKAELLGSHDDYKDDSNIQSILRFGTLLEYENEYFPIQITVKEFGQKLHGKRIYTVEAVDIKKSAGQLTNGQHEGGGRNVPIADFSERLQEMINSVKSVSIPLDENGEPDLGGGVYDRAGAWGAGSPSTATPAGKSIPAGEVAGTGEKLQMDDGLLYELEPEGQQELPFPVSKPPRREAYHGTPHVIEGGLTTEKMGTGEGAQVYGWGLYFAENRKVSEEYAENLGKPVVKYKGQVVDVPGRFEISTGKRTPLEDAAYWIGHCQGNGRMAASVLNNSKKHAVENNDAEGKKRADEAIKLLPELEYVSTGHLYKVSVPNEAELLDWDNTLVEQPESVQSALGTLFTDYLADMFPGGPEGDGWKLYKDMARSLGDDKEASRLLKEYGVKGIRYFDGNSRVAGKGTHNYVVFADEDIQITDMLYEMDGEEADNEGMGSSPEERQEVIDRYANADGSKKGGWLKAPNGKDTNLTERGWVEVRTPSFKAKHGDWEKYYYQELKSNDWPRDFGELYSIFQTEDSGGWKLLKEFGARWVLLRYYYLA